MNATRSPGLTHEAVQLGPLGLPGQLDTGPHPLGLVVLAGSGGARLARREAAMLEAMHAHGLATLHVGLPVLGTGGTADRAAQIDAQSHRLGEVLAWLWSQHAFGGHRLGLFGMGAAVAVVLRAAAEHPGPVAAVVAGCGRPDLAALVLPEVQAPTLLIVAARDIAAVDLHRDALRLLRCRKRLEVVPGASGRLQEPGSLAAAGLLAASWFETHLAADHLA
jgi:putative phosphoribosyl transferase